MVSTAENPANGVNVSCPRCGELVAPANLRCRSCNLLRAEFGDFDGDKDRTTGPSVASQAVESVDSSDDFELGPAVPGSSSGFRLPSANELVESSGDVSLPPMKAREEAERPGVDSVVDLDQSRLSLKVGERGNGDKGVPGDERAGVGSDPDVQPVGASSGNINDSSERLPSSSASRISVSVACDHCGTVNPVPKALLKSGVLCVRCGRPLATSAGSSAMASASGSMASVDSQLTTTAARDRRKHLKRAVEKALAAPAAEQPNEKFGKSLSKSDWKTLKSQIELVSGESRSPEALSEALEAVERLVESRDKRAVDLLVAQADSLPDAVRGRAKQAWGELRVPGCFEKLLKSLIDDVPELYAAIARGLGALGDRRATRTLLVLGTYWEGLNDAVRESLRTLGSCTLPELISLAERKDKSSLRPLATQAMGDLGDSQAIPVLANILKSDRRVAVRVIAAEALGRIEDRAVLGPLVAALKDSADAVRIAATIAMQSQPRKRIVPALVHVLNDPHPVVRENAARLIGHCGVGKAVAPLGLVTGDPEPRTRIAVFEALGRLGDETAVPQLGVMLDEARREQDDELLIQLAGVLGELKDARAILPLLNAMPGTRPAVQAKIVEALGDIKDGTVLPALIDVMTNGATPAVRTSAVSAIGRLGLPESVEPLGRAIQAGPPLKTAAVAALGDVHDEEAIGLLTELVSDPDANVRRLAATSLGAIGNESVFRKLRPLVDDSDVRVAAAATEALKQLGDDTVSEVAATPSKKAAKVKKPKVKVKKARKSVSMPSINLELLQTLSPADLKLLAMEYKAISGALVGLCVLAVVGVFFGSSIMRNTFTGGLDPAIVVRGHLTGISISPSGTRLAMSRGLGVLDVYDLETSSVIIDKKGPSADGVLFCSDDNALIGYSGEKAGVWNLETKEFVDGTVPSLGAYNADWSKFVSMERKTHTLSELDLATGQSSKLAVVEPPGKLMSVTSIATTPDLSRVLLGYRDGVVVIWSRGADVPAVMRTGLSDTVTALAISESGTRLAIGMKTGVVQVWETGAKEPAVVVEPAKPGSVIRLAFSGEDKLGIALPSSMKSVNPTTGQTLSEFKPACGIYDMVSVNRDGTRVAFARDEGNKIAVHNMSDGALIEVIEVPNL